METKSTLSMISCFAPATLAEARDLDRYVLVGGSFGAVITVAAPSVVDPPMFRFSHPARYSKAVHRFLQSTILTVGAAA